MECSVKKMENDNHAHSKQSMYSSKFRRRMNADKDGERNAQLVSLDEIFLTRITRNNQIKSAQKNYLEMMR